MPNNKKATLLVGVLVLIVLAVALAIWLRPVDSSREGTTILVVLKTLNNPYYIEMKRGVDDAASAGGGTFRPAVEAFDREDDIEGQTSVIRSYLARGGLAAVVLAPASSTELVPAIRELNDASVPVVVVDTRVDESALRSAGAHVDAFVASDNRRGGALAAQALASLLGDGTRRILLLEGVPTQETAVSRKEGFLDFTRESRPAWEIMTRVANWNREEGRAATEAFLNTLGKPDGVFGCNDEMALGSLAALEQSALVGSALPPVIGFDATPDARQAVEAGRLAGTVQQKPYEMGATAVDLAVSLAKGESLDNAEQLIAVELVEQ